MSAPAPEPEREEAGRLAAECREEARYYQMAVDGGDADHARWCEWMLRIAATLDALSRLPAPAEPAPAEGVRAAARVLLAVLADRPTAENVGQWHGAYELMALAFYHGDDDGTPPFWRSMRAFLSGLAQPAPSTEEPRHG